MSLLRITLGRVIKTIAIACSASQCLALPNITDELGPRLSEEAALVFPDSAGFLVATDRDNEQDPPTFAVVVEVATERDVQETVRPHPLSANIGSQTLLTPGRFVFQLWYANRHNISFLATTGLHGGTTSLGKLHRGINIWMRKMKSTVISGDGNSAVFGGGILGLEVRDALWAAGKQTGASARSQNNAVEKHKWRRRAGS